MKTGHCIISTLLVQKHLHFSMSLLTYHRFPLQLTTNHTPVITRDSIKRSIMVDSSTTSSIVKNRDIASVARSMVVFLLIEFRTQKRYSPHCDAIQEETNSLLEAKGSSSTFDIPPCYRSCISHHPNLDNVPTFYPGFL